MKAIGSVLNGYDAYASETMTYVQEADGLLLLSNQEEMFFPFSLHINT